MEGIILLRYVRTALGWGSWVVPHNNKDKSTESRIMPVGSQAMIVPEMID